jgi:hypothetical protein
MKIVGVLTAAIALVVLTGGTQVAINQVVWDGGDTLIPLPGEKRARYYRQFITGPSQPSTRAQFPNGSATRPTTSVPADASSAGELSTKFPRPSQEKEE